MENYLKLLKNAMLLALFSLFPLVVYSQATADELLDGYVSASVNKENVSPYKTKINQVYKSYRKDQQTEFRGKIYDRIKGDTITDQNILMRKNALIDLYALLADNNDSRLDDLYFQKGEICGLHTGDTIMLKECITGLKLSDQSKTPKVTNYITTLQDYLEQIRNYLPASQRMDGIWVSNRWYYDLFPIYSCTPAFVLNINQGKIKLETVGCAAKFADVAFWSNKLKNEDNTYAQTIVNINKDKVYIVWSNEKLKIPNQAVALSLGQTASDITTNAVTEVTSSLVGNIGGDIVGGIAGNIIGSAIMDMFAPSKKMYVLEMELEKVNDYELFGHFCKQVIKIDGNGKPDITREEQDIYFVKYDIKSGVYFGDIDKKAQKYIPGHGLFKFFPTSYSSIFNEIVKRYSNEHSRISKSSGYDYRNEISCVHQIRKLIYYNDQKMLRKGCKMSEKWHQLIKKAYIGVSLKSNFSPGAFVINVVKNSPAYLFGIKKDDIILSADGFEVESAEQFLKYLDSLHPYDWTTLHIKRGKREIDIQVELTYSESGKTTIKYNNGDIYEGEFAKGTRNGKGVYKWHDGGVYDGNWVNGVQHGQGVFSYANGDKYSGQFQNGIKQGQGMLKWKNGNLYQGEWKRDKPNGRGKLTMKNGDVFEGQFQNGQIHGKGIAHYADGLMFEGQFKDGKRHGPAIEEDKDGKRFEGSYVNGQRDGRFIEKDRNGTIIAKGTYNHGKRKEDK